MNQRRGKNGAGAQPTLRPNVLVARSVGILCIALGFVAGLQGLDQRDSVWLPTALGLIVTGMLAQGYVFYCLLRRRLGKGD